MTDSTKQLIFQGAIVLIILFAIYKVLQRIGLVKTAEDELQDTKIEQALNMDIFNTNFDTFYKNVWNKEAKNKKSDVVQLLNDNKCFLGGGTQQTNLNFASQIIYDAKATWGSLLATLGYVHDQDNKVLGLFKSAPSKLYICALSENFEKNYNRSLIDYLGFMDNKNLARITDIINKKPLFI
jgi:hypothetical protein